MLRARPLFLLVCACNSLSLFTGEREIKREGERERKMKGEREKESEKDGERE